MHRPTIHSFPARLTGPRSWPLWRRLLVAGLFLATVYSSPYSWAADLEAVRLGKHEQHTRLVFDLSGPTQPQLTRTGAATYELRLPGTRWKAKKLQSRDGLVRNVAPTPASAKSADLWLQVRLAANTHASLRTLSKPARVVLDLTEVARKTHFVVAIDPGHGGKAPGAVGKRGTLEKTVVLGICKRLVAALNARPGIRAVLTRNNDETLSLAERVEIARDVQADLFVSVHADAISDRRVRGGSVYVLSNTGAEHAARRWAGAPAEPGTKARNIAGIDLSKRDKNVANVLYDLVQNDTLERSNLLAGDVLSHMLNSTRVRFDEVRLANLGVLKAPDIPSVLVESAFISNVQDEALLKSSKGQRVIAQAIARGISGFIERPTEIARARNSAASETLIASTTQTTTFRKYAVASGDTLYSLARRFGVSVQMLTSANQIRGTAIKPGMTLKVPAVATVIAGGN